jgi:hypothetical protein
MLTISAQMVLEVLFREIEKVIGGPVDLRVVTTVRGGLASSRQHVRHWLGTAVTSKKRLLCTPNAT